MISRAGSKCKQGRLPVTIAAAAAPQISELFNWTHSSGACCKAKPGRSLGFLTAERLGTEREREMYKYIYICMYIYITYIYTHINKKYIYICIYTFITSKHCVRPGCFFRASCVARVRACSEDESHKRVQGSSNRN